MADRYLVASPWDSSTTASWSTSSGGAGGASVPTASDNVFIDANSPFIASVSGTVECLDIDFTGYTGVISATFADIQVNGSATNDSGIALFNAPLNFVSTSSGNTLTSNGGVWNNLKFSGIGGEWTFTDAILQSGSSFQAWAGTINMGTASHDLASVQNGHTVNGGAEDTCVINCGSCNMVWNTVNIPPYTGFTFNADTSHILCRAGINNTTSFDSVAISGTTTFNIFEVQSGFGLQQNFFGNCVFSELILTPSFGSGFAIQVFGDQTIDTLTITAAANTERVRICGLKGQVDFSVDTLSIAYTNFESINALGTADWDLTAITGNAGDCGNNTGITFLSPVNAYWKSDSGNFSDSGKWFTASGGATPQRVPLPQDSAIFDANSFTTGSQTVTMDVMDVGTLSFTGVTNAPEIDFTSTSIYEFGDITLDSGMSMLGSFGLCGFSGTLTPDGVTIPDGFSFFRGGNYIIAGNIITDTYGSISTQQYAYGGFDTDGFDVSVNSLQGNNPSSFTWNLDGSTIIFGQAQDGSGSFQLSESVTETVNATSAIVHCTDVGSGGGYDYFSTYGKTIGTLIVDGGGDNQFKFGYGNGNPNIVNSIQIGAPKTVYFESYTGAELTLEYGTFNAIGTSGNTIYFSNIDEPGTQYTFDSASNNGFDYLNLTDCLAIGTTPKYAGANSNDGGNNTDWLFADAPASGNPWNYYAQMQ